MSKTEELQERLVMASVKVEKYPHSVTFYFAKRHGDAILKAVQNFEGNHIQQKDQGFWTSKERHVNRAEALEIAIAAGQIKNSLVYGCVLTSEELW